MLSRAEVIDSMKRDALDVLVVGGGIVGSGVARDAAMRGLRVALLDRYDFAFGTSSRSSRLLHGGLRYLAQGRIGLVREASVEKVIIHHIAPHLAAPLPFVFPTRGGTEWKKWKLHLGVKVYDLLCSGRNLGKSSALSRDEVLRILPQLNSENLTGAVRYYDGMTNDARLVLDTLRSAGASGACLLNYASLETTRREGDVWHCNILDRHTDTPHQLKARFIVNAAGAWASSFPQSAIKLRLTKGVHIVIDRARLDVPDAVVMAQGKRILFAIPWGQRLILGTTDTDYAGPLDAPSCESDDIRYILDVANHTFPNAKLAHEDIISAWSGLRPLISAGEKGTPSDISRAHQIREPQPGWIDVAGGKLTTYRLMAEQAVDRVVELTKSPTAPCKTATTALLPDEPTPSYSGILPPPVTKEAVEHYCQNEWAQHLPDVMIRRTSWRYYHRDHLAIARDAVKWMATELGWSDHEADEEYSTYRTMTDSLACGEITGQVQQHQVQHV